MAHAHLATSSSVPVCRAVSGSRLLTNRTTCNQHQSSGRLQRKVTQPRPFTTSIQNASAPRAPLRQQLDVVDIQKHQQPLGSDSSSLLFGLPVEQQQTLLFLAISSGVLTTASVADAADLHLLADLSINKGQVIRFLVDNPFVLLGLAVALYLVVPRVLRFTTRFILLPAAIAGGVYLVITNPNTSYKVVSTAFGCKRPP